MPVLREAMFRGRQGLLPLRGAPSRGRGSHGHDDLRPGRGASSRADEPVRFEPGHRLGKRYRIVALIGHFKLLSVGNMRVRYELHHVLFRSGQEVVSVNELMFRSQDEITAVLSDVWLRDEGRAWRLGWSSRDLDESRDDLRCDSCLMPGCCPPGS
jgi:hypothetical protein